MTAGIHLRDASHCMALLTRLSCIKSQVMLHPLVSSVAPEYAKYAAWLTILLAAIAVLPHAKQAVAAFLLKLYEQIIQNNAPGL